MLMEPPFLFTAVPLNGELAPPTVAQPPQAPRCHVVIRALCGEQPMCWEVGVGLETLWGPQDDGSLPPSPPERDNAWDQALHRLTAASVVRDNEQLALRRGGETRADRGEFLVGPVRAQGDHMGQSGRGIGLCDHSLYLTLLTNDLRQLTHIIKKKN